MKIPTVSETREQMQELLETTRYHPDKPAKLDKFGMPKVAPEPNDPDDEGSERSNA